MSDTTRRDSPDLAAAIAHGEALYRAGAYRDAEGIFAGLAEHASDDPSLLRLLGMCRLRLGDRDVALDLLRRAHVLAPADPLAALHYGFALHANGEVAAAARMFAAAEPALLTDPAPALNLAACLHTLGEHARAEAAARRARLRAPRLAEARYLLGLTRMATGKLAAAEAEFTIALRLDPGLAQAWVNLGLIRYQRDDIQGAKQMMRQALGIAPGHPAATANLCVFLRLTGHPEEAETLLREAFAATPDAAEIRINLAVEHLQDGCPAEALALLDGPTPTERRAREHWLVQQALALIQMDRADEAELLIERIGPPLPALRPLVLWRRAMLAAAVGDADRARSFARAVETELTDAVLLEHRIITCYQLAQFWVQQGERAHGFSFWTRGHRLLARIQPFSREAHRGFVDAAIETFDRARLHAGSRAGNTDEAPVFIVGMPRSGTTLAEQIIGAHGGAFAAGERAALGQLFRHLGQGGDARDAVRRIGGLDTGALDDAADGYLAALHALAPAAGRIVDKMPGNAQHLGLVSLLMPGARIIHCTRDPRDTGLSIYTRRFFGYHPYAHDLGDLGWAIGEHQRLMAHWRAVIPNAILTLPMRDWIDDFDATLRRVLAFLGLPYDPACERFHEQNTRVRTASRWQVREPVNARGLDRWQEFADELQPMIAELKKTGLVEDASID